MDLCCPLQIALQQGQRALCPKLAPGVYLMLARLSFTLFLSEVDMHRVMFGIVNIVPDATPNVILSRASSFLRIIRFAFLRPASSSFPTIPSKILVNSLRLFLSFYLPSLFPRSFCFFYISHLFMLCQKKFGRAEIDTLSFLFFNLVDSFVPVICLFILKEATGAEGR